MTKEITFLTNDDLDRMYSPPGSQVMRAIKTHLTEYHLAYLEQASFFVLASGSETGLDASPRGGSPGVVQVIDDKTVCFADWPGNNKIESLRNIVQHPDVGMLFLFPGLDVFMRINGRAGLTADSEVLELLKEGARIPKLAVVVSISEILFHCGRAINRAALWKPESHIDRQSVPSVGQVMKALAELDEVPAQELDQAYAKGMIEDLY
ncbi:pyridoxamine 5'-phosphate oxidase [Novosphingobium sp. PC22D]|nr:pyridoxamine 5'-phosphate oxidase [Novosphingobium sp. PC22D]